ncbi:hypothetical protein GCM10007886_29570 [Methylobacterium gregans]|nr:hypothetical protein GCM10007886_29570 [Methylobacterium gregans]
MLNYESGGQRFESFRARHFTNNRNNLATTADTVERYRMGLSIPGTAWGTAICRLQLLRTVALRSTSASRFAALLGFGASRRFGCLPRIPLLDEEGEAARFRRRGGAIDAR